MMYIKQETGERPAPGNFVLDEEEFMEQVGNFTVVHYAPESQVVSEQEITLQDDEGYVRLRVENDSDLTINFRQTSLGGGSS